MNENPTVIFAEPKRAVLENRPVPEPGKGEVLIKTHRSLISTGTELTMLTGDFPEGSRWDLMTKYPCGAGYSNVGEVITVGPEVEEEWIGKRVATYGGHAQYVSIGVGGLHPVLHDSVTDEQASFFAIGGIVMNGVRRAKVVWGESVVVFGMGLLGQLTAQVCRLGGARPVVAVDVAQARLRLLPEDSAIIPVNPSEEDLVAAVKEATQGRMADVAFEVTGNPNLIADQFSVLRYAGRYVVLSSPRGKTLFDFHDLCNSPSFTIIGTHNGSHPQFATHDNPWTLKRHVELFFDLVAAGEVLLDSLISHRVPFTEAPAMYDMLINDRSQAMGVVFEWAE